jgi:hypothetical protein
MEFSMTSQIIVGGTIPIYAVFVLIQQGYATWRGSQHLMNDLIDPDLVFDGGNPEVGLVMDPDCHQLVDIFFLNEVVVGILTLV